MLALELPTSTRFASPSPTARAVPLAHRCAPHGGAVGRFGRFGRFAREDWTRAAGVVLLGAMASRKVAVIGGGPAGLAACRSLVRFGHRPVVFEAAEEVGGIWAEKPMNEVVYKGLVTNIPTMCMQSFDLGFSAKSSYVTGPELGSYFIDYAEHFKLRQFIRFQSRVEKVERQEKDDESWQVSWTSTDGSQAEDFDAVCVASGHYEFPYCPELPGQKEWLAASSERKILHALSYNDPEDEPIRTDFNGRSVLIVGGRSSAVDIARELRSRAGSLYVLESGCREVTCEDHCSWLPLGSSLTPEGRILAATGELVSGEPVDTVILATGYTYRFPFLDETALNMEFGPVRRYVKPLYQHIIHADYDTLCFLGIPLAVPSPLPLFEAQAYFAASHLREAFTSRKQRQEWVQQDLHFISGYAWDHMRLLMREAGMADSDYSQYDRRLKVVQAIYQDRVDRKPRMPWDDDAYRRCQYQARRRGTRCQNAYSGWSARCRAWEKKETKRPAKLVECGNVMKCDSMKVIECVVHRMCRTIP
ncbi:Flavin-containing monooxygenase FMO GS-OX-like 9 (Flavin-monooxygenase glucosinolate S-oxygenase-like 9) [Durusdinium trenchii]|uniref:Flavin-containing monooxygenase FMO GS-OX-like 9 (Flavin-monooxygenase glucosinolate S-oxygenase-like 9) n=1 Tax=Durusdinium trenchii TaxID=1381693 RepID=A0ABP0KL26_9DINO